MTRYDSHKEKFWIISSLHHNSNSQHLPHTRKIVQKAWEHRVISFLWHFEFYFIGVLIPLLGSWVCFWKQELFSYHNAALSTSCIPRDKVHLLFKGLYFLWILLWEVVINTVKSFIWENIMMSCQLCAMKVDLWVILQFPIPLCPVLVPFSCHFRSSCLCVCLICFISELFA